MKNKHATHITYVDIMLGAEFNLLLQLSILLQDDNTQVLLLLHLFKKVLVTIFFVQRDWNGDPARESAMLADLR